MSKDKLFILFLFTIAILISIDIADDYVEGESLIHLAIEFFVVLFSCVALVFIIKEYREMQNTNIELQSDLEKTKVDASKWRADAERYLEGLGSAIDKQMTRWEFSTAEKEVGLLLLKGFSFKEIADLRDTTERTARQQSLNIYKKSSLDGRASFSAFFLEDLLLPPSESDHNPDSN